MQKKFGGIKLKTESVRLTLFNKLLENERICNLLVDGFCIPYTAYEMIDNHKELSSFLYRQIRAHFGNLENVLIHSCPVDEKMREDLSFAGTYSSYKPRRRLSLEENVELAIQKLFVKSGTNYTDYYYLSHGINTKRQFSLFISKPVDNAAMYGTAYCCKGNCMVSYFDTPLSIYKNDPVRFCSFQKRQNNKYEKNLIHLLREIETFLRCPIDVEFIISRDEKIWVTEVRPISQAHLTNWSSLDEKEMKYIEAKHVKSNVLNRVGEFTGKAIDLRKITKEELRITNSNDIYVINHHSKNMIDTISFLKYIVTNDLTEINLLVDHGEERIDDHLQYITYEEKRINCLFHVTTNELKNLEQNNMKIKCNHFEIDII